MHTIYKYELTPNCTIPLPAGAELLTVATQGSTVILWAKVDPSAPTELRRFVTFGTGQEIRDALLGRIRFVGTSFLGSLVFHTFELLPAVARAIDSQSVALERKCSVLWRSGQKVAAIKHWRAETGDGLKDAKDAMDRLASRDCDDA